MNQFKVTFLIVFMFLGQNLFSQKYTFKIQGQYSHYESEKDEKADHKIVFLCNNYDDAIMKFFVFNDTVKNISIYDRKAKRVYFSRGEFVLNSNTNLNYSLSSQKYELRLLSIDEKTNKNVIISTNKIEDDNIINIKEFKNIKKKNKIITYDLYIRTVKNSKYINTQNFTIGMITHHRIWGDMGKINSEVVLESYYLKDNIKTDIYKLDNIEEINFEITVN